MTATTLAPSTGATVELQGVVKDFGGHRALNAIDLSIRPGEFVALLGPSGCGKTTALRALSGLESVDGGSILIDGEDVASVPTNKRDIGMVFQSYSLFPHMTVVDNVEFGLRMRKVGAADRRARATEALELVGLGQLGAQEFDGGVRRVRQQHVIARRRQPGGVVGAVAPGKIQDHEGGERHHRQVPGGAIEPAGEDFGRRSFQAVAVLFNRHLNDQRLVGHAAHALNGGIRPMPLRAFQ